MRSLPVASLTITNAILNGLFRSRCGYDTVSRHLVFDSTELDNVTM